LVTNIQALRFANPVINKIKNELGLEPKQVLFTSNNNLIIEKELTLKDISFQYDKSENYALDNINLSILSGQSIGIIGSSGAGKSTLVDIILGLLRPHKGKMLVDGKEINSENIQMWQKNIGYVSQSIYILDDSFKNNIAFGIPKDEIDDEKINNATKLAQLETFINELPEGLNTFAGEQGVRISGGQLQRIGIARALYNNPSILVFDEATSALDNETEKSVMDSITNLQGNKTIIIIAHRLTTVKDCDIIIELDKGSIIKKGTPREML